MRTSLNEIAEIEKYIFRQLPPEEKILLDASLVVNEEFRMKVFLQDKIYRLLYLFHKKTLKKEAEEVFRTLMKDPLFQQEISTIFNNKSND